jgi:predicted RNase H-like nuclease
VAGDQPAVMANVPDASGSKPLPKHGSFIGWVAGGKRPANKTGILE